MKDQKDLPKPQTDLPLPEKELSAQAGLVPQGDALEPQNPNLRGSTPKSKWLMLGIVAVVLLVLLGGVYILGRNSVFKELNPTNPAIPPKSPVIYQGTPTPNPTADWKTYTSDGYTFKYPNSLKTLPKDSANDIGLEFNNGERIHVFAQNISVNLSVRDWLEKEFPPSESAKFEDVNILGKDSVQKNDYSVTHINQGGGKILTITFVKCDGPGCGAGTNIKSFQEILSTFKFTQ